MPSTLWVDQPYPLIPTEHFSEEQSHGANYAATQMALAHNGIIRGLNSIYLQATALSQHGLTTIKDFLTYCQCWCESMHHHHDVEEELFFPSLENIANQPGLMSENVEQHRAFTPGFEAFYEHVKNCRSTNYDGMEIRSLIEAFAEPLTQHLRDEINTLRRLDKYDSKSVRSAYNEMDKRMRNSDSERIAPLVFGTADRTFESGQHNFPAVPFFVPYIIHYVFERAHRGAWRFNPCTSWREPRELAFRPNPEETEDPNT